MKIYGIGTDITSIQRIKKSVKNKKFFKRLFSNEEIAKCNKQKKIVNCYAKRFAAKEAFSKAVGTGISGKVNFRAINILRDSNGKPFFEFDDVLKKLLSDLGIIQSHVSLSDERDYAIAYVILEK